MATCDAHKKSQELQDFPRIARFFKNFKIIQEFLFPLFYSNLSKFIKNLQFSFNLPSRFFKFFQVFSSFFKFFQLQVFSTSSFFNFKFFQLQAFFQGFFYKIFKQNFYTKFFHRIFLHNFSIRFLNKTLLKNFSTKFFNKIFQ